MENHILSYAPASKDSADTRQCVLDPNNPFEDFDKQPSYGFIFNKAGGSIFATHTRIVSDRDAKTILFVDQVHQDKLQKLRKDYGIDISIDDLPKEQLIELQTAVERELADRFEIDNEAAGPSLDWLENLNHYFVIPNNDVLTDIIQSSVYGSVVKEGQEWTQQGSMIERAVLAYQDAPLRGSTESPVEEGPDDASASWSARSSLDGGDRDHGWTSVVSDTDDEEEIDLPGLGENLTGDDTEVRGESDTL